MDEKLIKAVQMHPCLYNKGSPAYSNKITKAKSWDAVATEVGQHVEWCQARWRSLRDRFTKVIAEKEKSRSATGGSPKWRHMNAMSFLRCHINIQNSQNSSPVSSLPWMKTEEELIAAVKKHPCLYDKKAIAYRNKIVRDESWNEVANAVGQNVEWCQTRWRSLRDRFGKETAEMLRVGAAAGDHPKWRFMKSLSFLRGHITPRKFSRTSREQCVSQTAKSTTNVNKFQCLSLASPLPVIKMEEELIEAVQMRPCLYNKEIAAYRNKIMRAKSWNAVAKAVGQNLKWCQTRWRSLRDRFIKESIEMQRSGAAADSYQKWRHMKAMSFLRNHIKSGKTSTQIEFPLPMEVQCSSSSQSLPPLSPWYEPQPSPPVSSSAGSPVPSPVPSPASSPVPSRESSPVPSPAPSRESSPVPSPAPSRESSPVPSPASSPVPSTAPSPVPSPVPSSAPSPVPSVPPSPVPSSAPSPVPSRVTSPSPSLTSRRLPASSTSVSLAKRKKMKEANEQFGSLCHSVRELVQSQTTEESPNAAFFEVLDEYLLMHSVKKQARLKIDILNMVADA